MKIQTVNIMTDIAKMREDAEQRQKEVLCMIEALSEAPSSDSIHSMDIMTVSLGSY